MTSGKKLWQVKKIKASFRFSFTFDCLEDAVSAEKTVLLMNIPFSILKKQ